MKRMGLLLIGGGLLSAVCVVGWQLGIRLSYVPDFYAAALQASSDTEERRQKAEEFREQTRRFVVAIHEDESWTEEFSQPQVNGWLAEETRAVDSSWLPPQISDPRIAFTSQTIHVGFQLDDFEWDGVVSLEIRPAIVEPNRVALHVVAARAGNVELPLEQIWQEVADRVSVQGCDVQWSQDGSAYRVELTFDQLGDGDPQLESVEVIDGAIRVSGSREVPASSVDHLTLRESNRRTASREQPALR